MMIQLCHRTKHEFQEWTQKTQTFMVVNSNNLQAVSILVEIVLLPMVL